MPLHLFPFPPLGLPTAEMAMCIHRLHRCFAIWPSCKQKLIIIFQGNTKRGNSLHWISTSSLEWFNVKLLSVFWQALGWVIELAPVTLVVLVSIVTLLRGLHQGQDVAFLRTGILLSPAKEWGPRSRPFSIYFFRHKHSHLKID